MLVLFNYLKWRDVVGREGQEVRRVMVRVFVRKVVRRGSRVWWGVVW